MACAKTFSGLGVEVFVEWNQFAPVRVLCPARILARAGAVSRIAAPEQARDAVGKFLRNLAQRHEL